MRSRAKVDMPVSVCHTPIAAEFPIFRVFTQIGPNGISFDITKNRVEMVVVIDRKSLEPTLTSNNDDLAKVRLRT